MRIRGVPAVALMATVAGAQPLATIEGELTRKLERASVAAPEFAGLVAELAENQYQQGYPERGWQSLRSGIARSEENRCDVAFQLRMRLTDDLVAAGLFDEAAAETRTAGTAAKSDERTRLLYAYAQCGACEDAKRIRSDLPAGSAGTVSICGFSGPVVVPPNTTRFIPTPGAEPEAELRERMWFARGLNDRQESLALRDHIAETVAFAERNSLKQDASELVEMVAGFAGDEFEPYAARVAQLAGPDPGVIDRIAEAWLVRGEGARASSLFEQSRSIRSATHGPASWDLLPSLTGLERSALLMRDWDAARQLSRELAAILEVSTGPRSRALCEHLLSSAERFQSSGQREIAEDLWDRGMRLAEDAYGPRSRLFAETLERAAKATGRAVLDKRARAIQARFPDPGLCLREER